MKKLNTLFVGLFLIGCSGSVEENVSQCSNWVTYTVPVNHCLFAEAETESISDEVNTSCAVPEHLYKEISAYTVPPLKSNDVKIYCKDHSLCTVRVVSPEEDINCFQSIGAANKNH